MHAKSPPKLPDGNQEFWDSFLAAIGLIFTVLIIVKLVFGGRGTPSGGGGSYSSSPNPSSPSPRKERHDTKPKTRPQLSWLAPHPVFQQRVQKRLPI